MGDMVLQRVLAVATQHWAHKPELLTRIQQDAATGDLCPHLQTNPWLSPTVSLEADGLIKSSFVDFHIQRFIEDWAAEQPLGSRDPVPATTPPREASPVGEVQAACEAPPADEVPLARSELVQRLKPQWPSIEADLAYCQMNGLHRAKSGPYDWFLSIASAWARQHDKLKHEP